MLYKSTRDKNIKVTSARAIVTGLSNDGGLFVPEYFDTISSEDIILMQDKTYQERSIFILSKFLTDFSSQEISDCVNSAYTTEKFSTNNIIETVKLGDTTHLLELWHGPTCAFKDMALQLLPFLMKTSSKIIGDDTEIVILVATSGDTGKAALEGFKDIDGIKVIVFYPEDGVSQIQKLQMTTQEGDNVFVAAIKGNFDDAQTAVKQVFKDVSLKEKLKITNQVFSSANSMNWGRLVPQIVYYISCYVDLVKNGEINIDELVNICVPTGNFGNILAAYYAKKMGLPVNRLICASNENDVLTDFIKTGLYDKNRIIKLTNSPSMDIIISSNLERLLFDLSNQNDEFICRIFENLEQRGYYEIPDSIKIKINEIFTGYSCNDNDTEKTIKDTFYEYGYLIDTHTAVALNAYNKYKYDTKDETKTIVVSTANPYKFPSSVMLALVGEDKEIGEYDKLKIINDLTGLKIPKQIFSLQEKEILFKLSINKEDIIKKVEDIIDKNYFK